MTSSPMRRYWLRVGIRAVIAGPYKTFGRSLRSEPTERRIHAVLPDLFSFQPSAWCSKTNGSTFNTLLGNKAVGTSSFRLPDSEIDVL